MFIRRRVNKLIFNNFQHIKRLWQKLLQLQEQEEEKEKPAEDSAETVEKARVSAVAAEKDVVKAADAETTVVDVVAVEVIADADSADVEVAVEAQEAATRRSGSQRPSSED